MARIMFGLALILAGLIQATIFPAFGLLEVMPDVALVLLLIWSAGRPVEESLIWAFGLGLWFDFLTLDPLGAHAIAFLVVALIGGAVRGRFFRSGAILPIGTVILATIGFNIVFVLIEVLTGESVLLIPTFRLALIAALLNTLIVPLVYVILLFVERWTPRRVS